MKLHFHPDGKSDTLLEARSDDERFRLEVSVSNDLYVVDNNTGNVQKEQNVTLEMLFNRLREIDALTDRGVGA